MSDDVRRIIKELSAEIGRRGTVLTPTIKRDIAACASDQAMVARCQAALADGEAVSVDDYMRLKQEALASRTRLLGEPVERVTGIRVELVPAPAQYTKLKDEIAVLKLQLAAYQSGQYSGPSEPAGAPAAKPSRAVRWA
jgi:hypothetical protein